MSSSRRRGTRHMDSRLRGNDFGKSFVSDFVLSASDLQTSTLLHLSPKRNQNDIPVSSENSAPITGVKNCHKKTIKMRTIKKPYRSSDSLICCM